MAELNTNQVETLGITSEVIADAAFTVLSMLLGREIDLIPLRSAFLTTEEVKELKWEKVILARASFTKGLEGTIFFILNIEDSTRIIDLMLGGEGEAAQDLDEDSSDALSETINQIMGASCQTFTEKTGSSISIGQVEILCDENTGILTENIGGEEFSGIEFSLDLDTLINSKMFVALDDQLLESINQGLHRKPEGADAPVAEAPAPAPAPAAPAAGGTPMAAGPVVQAPQAAAPAPGMAAPPPMVQAAPLQSSLGPNIDLLMDIELPVIIRIGRTELLLQDILKLTPGAIIELHKSMDDPIDMLVNNKLVARGEVVVVDGNFAFRITEIVSTAARIRSLA